MSSTEKKKLAEEQKGDRSSTKTKAEVLGACYFSIRPMRSMASPFLCLLLILATTIPSTYYIYNYPRIHGCSWPNPEAPFRLLALADPQIEGDKKQKSWRGISILKSNGDDC
jgi:hypothetical protein